MTQQSESKIQVYAGMPSQLIPADASVKVANPSRIVSKEQKKKQAQEPMYLNRL